MSTSYRTNWIINDETGIFLGLFLIVVRGMLFGGQLSVPGTK